MSASAKLVVNSATRIKNNQAFNIYIFHRVLDEVDPLNPSEPDVSGFEIMLQIIAGMHEVVPLSYAVASHKQGGLPLGAACITFDDGYRDNLTNAAPLLRKYNLPATIFVTSGVLDGGVMWNDSIIGAVRYSSGPVSIPRLNIRDVPIATIEQKLILLGKLIPAVKYLDNNARDEFINELLDNTGYVPVSPMMSSEDVAGLGAYNIDVGAHTRNHPILSEVSDDVAQEEIIGSKQDLEKITGKEISLFAYPNGKPMQDYDERHVDMVKNSGFSAAVSTVANVASVHSPIYELPRFTPWRRGRMGWLMQMMRAYM